QTIAADLSRRERLGRRRVPLLDALPFLFCVACAVHRPLERAFEGLTSPRCIVERTVGFERRFRTGFGRDDERRAGARQTRDLQVAGVTGDVRIEERAELVRLR